MKKTLTLALLSAGVVAADCVDGARNTTPEEQGFYNQMMPVLRDLMPPAPAGWQAQPEKIYAAASSVCKGSDATVVAYGTRFTNMDLVKEQNRIADEYSRKTAALHQLPADKMEQMNGLSRQVRGLQRELPKARAAGNTAEVDRINAEIRKLSDEGAAIRKAHLASVQPQLMALVQEQTKSMQGAKTLLYVRIMINNGGIKTPGKTQDAKETVIMMGTRHDYSSRSALKVDNVVVTIDGDPAQAELFLKNWDTTALAALTKGAMPAAKVSAGL